MKRDRKYFNAISSILCNDEYSSDEELEEHFVKEFGLSNEQAHEVVKLRQDYLVMPVVDPDESALEIESLIKAVGKKPKRSERVNAHDRNKQIEQFIDEAKPNASFTKEDLQFISQYEGSGGLAKHGAQGRGLLHEFFTPVWLVDLVWKLAKAHGFNGGTVLEPSCGTGRFFEPAPDKSKCVGFEINKYSAFIAEKIYPGVTIHRGFFEQAFMEAPRHTKRLKGFSTWLKEYPFSLVIGNPPYGQYHNEYSTFFKNPSMLQNELMFCFYGLQLLKPGGLLVYVISSNLLRNGSKYYEAKREIGQYADLIDAYRLPSVFEHSDIPTDIIVLRKKP